MLFNGNQKEIKSFLKFMNSIEPSIKFTIEVQNNNKLPFLDVMLERTNAGLITYVYRKPTDTGLYLRWTSNQPRIYKTNLIKYLCQRARRICSSEELLKQELDYYKRILFSSWVHEKFSLSCFAFLSTTHQPLLPLFPLLSLLLLLSWLSHTLTLSKGSGG